MDRRFRLTGAGLLGSVLVATLMALAPSVVSSEGAASIEADLADAVRFRTTFGLAADAELVRAARLDPLHYSSEPYGVPLTQSEIADLLVRAQVQRALEAVEIPQSAVDSFAGTYIDQHMGGLPVFMFTADIPGIEQAIAEQLPPGTAFRVARAARTGGICST
jgi:hypothetical protein